MRALLAYLAIEADRPHRRAVLAALLWPDRSDSAALNNLRYTLSHLRHAIGDAHVSPPFLLITRHTIQFNPAGDAWVDVAALLERLARAARCPPGEDNLRAAVASFLEGFFVGDSASFDEWVHVKRDEITRHRVRLDPWDSSDRVRERRTP